MKKTVPSLDSESPLSERLERVQRAKSMDTRPLGAQRRDVKHASSC